MALIRKTASERKRQIIEVSLKLFSEKGFEGTKTREIAEAVGVSEAAVFKLFKNKPDIIAKCLEYQFSKKYDLLEKIQQPEAMSREEVEKKYRPMVEEVVAQMIWDMQENRKLIVLILRTLMDYPEYIRTEIIQLQEADDKRSRIQIEQAEKKGLIKKFRVLNIAQTINRLIMGLMIDKMILKNEKILKTDCKKYAREIMEIFLNGVLK